MSLRRQAIQGLKWQAIEIGGRQAISFIVFAVLAHLLDPAAFGLVALVGVYLAFVSVFVDQGIGIALIQRREIEPSHLDAAFWFNIGCAMLLSVSTIAFASPISSLFREPRVVPLLRWSSLAFVINAAGAVHSAQFVRAMDFSRPAVQALLANVVGGAVGIVMALRGLGVWSLIGQQLTAAFVGCGFLWLVSPWRPTASFSFRHLRQLLGISFSVFVTDCLWFFSSRLDQVVVGRVGGAVMLGQYTLGGKFADFASTAVHKSVGTISIPALSKLQDDRPRMCEAIYKGMEMNAIISFAIFVGLSAVAPTLVPVAFGHQWQPAAPLMQLLSIYNLAVGLFVYCAPALLASGGPGRYVLLSIACASGSAIACIVGIRFSVQSLIIGLIANMIVVGVLALAFLRNRIGLDPWRYCQTCLIPAFASVIMFAVVVYIRNLTNGMVGAWSSLFLQVAAGSIAYIAVMYAMASRSLLTLCGLATQAVADRAQAV